MPVMCRLKSLPDRVCRWNVFNLEVSLLRMYVVKIDA